MSEQTPGPDQPGSASHGQQPYSAHGQQPMSGPGRPGALGKRFLARFVDSILVGIVSAIVTAIVAPIIAPTGTGSMLGGATGAEVQWGAAVVTTIITVAINLGYFTLLESNRGQTLGKMLVGVRVLGPNGGNPTTTEAVKRNIWVGASILGIVPVVGKLFGGIASLVAVISIAVGINNDTVTRKGWHDSFAGGTRVVTTQ